MSLMPVSKASGSPNSEPLSVRRTPKRLRKSCVPSFLLQPVKNHADSPFGAAVHQKRQKEFFPFKEKSQEDFFDSFEE